MTEHRVTRRLYASGRTEQFVLLGSHTSTAPVGREPTRKPGCTGCAAQGGTANAA